MDGTIVGVPVQQSTSKLTRALDLAVGATIGAIAYASLVIYVFKHGFGVHQWNISAGTLIGLTDAGRS